jgi:hypothetical protein
MLRPSMRSWGGVVDEADGAPLEAPLVAYAGVGCGWDGSLADRALSTASLGWMRPK